MGYTSFEINLIKKYIYNVSTVLDLGSQNLYLNGEKEPPFVSDFYKLYSVSYACIDLAGDNNALQLDLSHPLLISHTYTLVVDAGTSEHVVTMNGYTKVAYHDGYINSIYPKEVKGIEEGYYHCWLNKHNFLAVEGIMISINPKTGMWPGHGYSYLTEDFYTCLAALTDYEILELGENCAMSNCETGKNIYCVLKKHSNVFPDYQTFLTLPVYKS